MKERSFGARDALAYLVMRFEECNMGEAAELVEEFKERHYPCPHNFVDSRCTECGIPRQGVQAKSLR